MTEYLPLGTHVTFDKADILDRYSDKLPAGHPARHGYLKAWKRSRFAKRGTTQTGVIVGVRTLANGYCSWQHIDAPIVFRPESYFTVYLVAFDPRRKPVYLHIWDCIDGTDPA